MRTKLTFALLSAAICFPAVLVFAADPKPDEKKEAEARAFIEEAEKRREAQGLRKLTDKEKDQLLELGGFLAAEMLLRRERMNLMRQIALALKAYANDDVAEQLFPTRLGELVDKEYVRDPKVFIDPANPNPPALRLGVDVDAKSDYAYEGKGLKDDGDAEKIILYCKGRDGRGRTVFFCDGHGEWIPEDEFRKRLAAQRAAVKEGLLK
jgi:hypothetical protein